MALPLITAGLGLASTIASQSSAKKARDLIDSIGIPDIADQELFLEQMVLQGMLTPEEVQAYQQEESELRNIQTNPDYTLAQQEALNDLIGISKDGMTATDRARLQQIQSQEQATSRGARDAILSNARARGAQGSGFEMLALLQNQQQGANRQAQRDLDVKAQAEQRALQALIQSGNMAGQMQHTQFNQQAQQAQAQDAINRFNTQNQQSVANQNVANRNTAQQANLNAQQSIANQNVGIRNQEQAHNKGLIQQQFGNQMAKAGQQVNQQNQQTDFLSNLGGTLFETGGNLWAAQDKKKKDED